MASNSSINLVDLDFERNKQSFIDFLSSQTQFKDYDFTGSNINVLLDILSYNTYKMGFYYNMLIGEAFLDSAQTRDSIVSHAKELNYLPRSKRSAKANVSVSFTATGESAPYIVQKGSPFTALVKNKSFTFTLPEDITVISSNNTYTFDTYIYEGVYLQDVYIVSENIEFPRYKITNKNVDISSVSVLVYEDGNEIGEVYTYTDTLIGLDLNSKVFFLQSVDNGYYELLFGDNFFGKKPKLGSMVSISYRISSGPAANGSRTFSVDFDPTGSDELLSTPTIIVNEVASDGLDEQDTESIRIYAPRYFATQQRAVSSDDYSSLILSKFPGIINDVVVYGGETVEPKKYGRVIISIKPNSGRIAPDFIKNEIKSYMLDYVSLPTRIELTDPEYFYIDVITTIQYDTTITDKTSNEIKGLVSTAINSFNTTNLGLFDNDFRFSRFVNAIDNAHDSITSNETQVKIIKRLTPTPNFYNSYEIHFNNEFHPGRTGYDGHPVVTSSSFYYIDDNGIEYPFTQLRDDGTGKIVAFTTINNQTVIVNNSLGTVDYTNGIILINNLLVSEYGNYISIKCITLKRDMIMNKNNIIFIEPTDVNITVIGTIN